MNSGGAHWSNVKLILAREIRDQLRDRRTLFMIAVLPLLLYPLLGMSFFQVAQFMREQPSRVLVVGLPKLEGLPALVEKDRFAEDLFSKPDRARLLKVDQQSESIRIPGMPAEEMALAQEALKPYDLVLEFPPDFADRLTQFRAQMKPAQMGSNQPTPADVPGPEVYYTSAKEASQIAQSRIDGVLARWREKIGQKNLEQSRVPANAAKPFSFKLVDVAPMAQRKAVLWSKVLPFVLLLWALTGAFYPAVDLCAGEKERGTLETLLSSPAERSEIVWGKLLTVMLFSIATAMLNLLSMGITGLLIVRQLPELGPPPLMAIVWLLLALIPVSALFSGLCLALAAFARSSKEGQYYLMPLVLVTMPLTILPMSPGVELNLGNSLIPVTGVVLLLRTLLEGNYALALPYISPVVAVTLVCCLWAVRWAADQFNTESVLFRESERLDMGLWLRRLRSDRDDTPSVAEALFCGVLILLIKFFMGLALPAVNNFHDMATMVLVVQLAVIATPVLLMTIMLTRSPRQTLLLRWSSWVSLGAAFVLAVVLHPLAMILQTIITKIYPLNEELATQLHALMQDDAPIIPLVLVFAVVPALCEELAFRGFILSGLRHLGHKWRAIILSSIFFGVTHAIFQQSLTACVLGALLGFVAVQTGSLLPAIVFHVTHNSLFLTAHRFLPDLLEKHPSLTYLARPDTDGGYQFTWPTLIAASFASMLLLAWFHRLPHARTDEEELQETIEHQAAHSAAI